MYRYTLWREWNSHLATVAFVMLNPSTADADNDDPTIRRCTNLARSWGYGSLEVVNLFAYRTSEPRQLRQALDPIGPDNDRYLLDAADRAQMLIIAWGIHGTILARDQAVLALLARRCNISYLRLTESGQPRHPLYLRREITPVPFRWRTPGCPASTPRHSTSTGS